METQRDLAWGDGRTMQCANDVLLSCTGHLYGFTNQYPPPNKFNFFKKKQLPRIQDCFLLFFSCGGMEGHLPARFLFLPICRTSATCLDNSVRGLRNSRPSEELGQMVPLSTFQRGRHPQLHTPCSVLLLRHTIISDMSSFAFLLKVFSNIS